MSFIKKNLVFLFLTLWISGFSQTLVPGMYRYQKDQNEVKISVSGSGIRFKSWSRDILFTKTSNQRYDDAKDGFYLSISDQGNILLGNEKYNIKEPIILYAPEGHQNAKSNMVQFTLAGDTYFATVTNDPVFRGTYL
jgi:hypothetical protein